MAKPEPKPLKPIRFMPAQGNATPEVETAPEEKPLPLLILLGVSITLLVGLLLLLPGWNTEPSVIALPEKSNGPSGKVDKPEIERASASPFADAQEAQQRRDAQEALQSLLNVKKKLDDQAVTEWAMTEFAQAIDKASSGDAAYSTQDFESAGLDYLLAGNLLKDILNSIPERINKLITELTTAINTSELEIADQLLTKLSKFETDDLQYGALERRVSVMPEVIRFISEARNAAREARFDEAILIIQAAITKDQEHPVARSLLVEYREKHQEQLFILSMSEGFSALQLGNFESAQTSFRTATKLKPEAAAPRLALQEVADAKLLARLAELEREAKQFEREERWREAEARFSEALGLDASIDFASRGLERSQFFADLYEGLARIENEPDRLTDNRVLNNAVEQIREAKTVENPGPALKALLEKVINRVSYATTPVPVTFTSDGATEVRILRVIQIDYFEITQLQLRPGRYEARGSRDGYQDVRLEFVVTPNQISPIDIRCSKTI